MSHSTFLPTVVASVDPPINKIRERLGGTKKMEPSIGGIGWGDEKMEIPAESLILADFGAICHGGIIKLPFGGFKKFPAPPGGCLGGKKRYSRFEKAGGLRWPLRYLGYRRSCVVA